MCAGESNAVVMDVGIHLFKTVVAEGLRVGGLVQLRSRANSCLSF